MLSVFNNIRGSIDTEVQCFVEMDCKRLRSGIVCDSTVLTQSLPSGWDACSISSFGFTAFFAIYGSQQCTLLNAFVSKYFNRAWAEFYPHCFPKHKMFVNVLVRMAISSTTLPPGTSPGDWLLP